MKEMQLTASAGTHTHAALSAPITPTPAAVVRHLSSGFGHKQVVAFLLDTDLPDGTQLVPAEGVMAWMRGAVVDGNHGYRVTSDIGAHSHAAWPVNGGAHSHAIREPSEAIGEHCHNLLPMTWPNNDGIARDERLPRPAPLFKSPEAFIEHHLGKPYQAPRKFTDAELLAIYHGMDSQAILANKEPGSFGDAILAAFAREVLKAAGVQA